MIQLIAKFVVSSALAITPDLPDSANSSQWIELKNTDGKVQTFIHQAPRKNVDAEKPSFLSIYKIDKEASTLKLMAEIKRDSKIRLDLAPANCYETDSFEPGVQQTWCENEKSFFTVIVEGGKVSMKENERTKVILASILPSKRDPK